jgi:hypothetical protein
MITKVEFERREPTLGEISAEIRDLRKEIRSSRIQPVLMSIAEVAQYIGASKHTVEKNWRLWLEYGVHPVRLHGKANGGWRFKKSEIDRMINEHWSVMSV